MYGQLVFYKDTNIIQSFLYIFSKIHEETLLLHVIILQIIGLKRVKAYFSLISNIKSTQKGISMFHLLCVQQLISLLWELENDQLCTTEI